MIVKLYLVNYIAKDGGQKNLAVLTGWPFQRGIFIRKCFVLAFFGDKNKWP